MNTPTQPTPDDEISLLDILVVLAENFWLLVLVPLAIGAITFGVVAFLPKTYESIAVLQPIRVVELADNAEAVSAASMTARLKAPELQVAAAQSQPWIARQQLDQSSLESFLNESISVRTDRQSGLVTLTTFARSAAEARDLARSVIENYVADVSPRGAAKERILQSIEIAQNALSVLDPAISSILQLDPSTGEVTTDLSLQVTSRPALADLVAQRTENEKTVSRLRDSLTVTTDDIVLQAPTLEEKPTSPKRLQITVVAILLSGFALTVFVFIRAALRAVADNPDGAEKVVRIRRGILLR